MNNNTNSDKTRRITIDLKAPAVAELDRLREITGLKTADLFRYAFNLLRLYVSARQSGGEVRIEDGKVSRLIELPFVLALDKGEHSGERSERGKV